MAFNPLWLRSLCGVVLEPTLRARGDVALAALEEAGATILAVAAPVLLKHLIDVIGHANPPLWTIVLDSLAFTGAWSGSSVLSTARLVHTGQVIEKVARHITQAALKTQLPDVALSEAVDGAELASTLERLPFSLQLVLDGLIWRTPPLLIQVVAAVAVIATLAPPRYAVVLAATLAAYLLIVLRSAHKLGRRAATMNLASLTAASAANDLLKNAARAVFNGAAAYEIERYGCLAETRRARSLQVTQWLATASAQQAVMIFLGLGLLLILGGHDVANGRMTLGVFVLLQTFAVRITAPLNGMALTLRQSAPALSNLSDALRLASRRPGRPSQLRFGDAPAGVVLQAISFDYPDGHRGLTSISVDLPPAALVAIVGPNASGKSTLARVLGGHLQPKSGHVWIDGVDLFALAPAERAQLVLYIPQTISLFDRSLVENGVYPPSRHTQLDLLQALEAAALQNSDEPIDLRRRVGEHGAKLSGGQVQKLELTRLLGVEVSTLILDETTSALDPVSAETGLKALRLAHPRATLILITHERRLAALADQVLYLEDGQIRGLHPHSVFLRTDSQYRRFWECDDAPA